MLAIRFLLSCLFFALCICGTVTQIAGAEYIDYRPGDLNLIITAPHGGSDKPSTIGDRTAGCYNADTKKCTYQHDCTPDYDNCPVKNVSDTNTYQAAEKIRNYVYNLTGKYAYLVANRLHRVKLDANREINEATFGEPIATANYQYYHNVIDDSKAQIDKTGLFNSLLILDIHGQTHTHNLTELGYNLTARELDTGVYSLQRTSTLRYAANKTGNTNAIVIGNVSMGKLLEEVSIPCMPSPVNPTVNGRAFLDGGYTAETHSSKIHDALQIELSRAVRFAETTEFDRLMRSVATALTNFLRLHYAPK